MDKQDIFERNLLALARFVPLCSKLSRAQTTLNRYKFLDSPSGELIPAWVDPSGSAHPLHSLVDPHREARRLIDTVNEGFIILTGLGGGFYAEAALEKPGVSLVLVIDYDINGIAELLCHRDYIKIFSDPRFHFLADPPENAIEQYILNIYQPMLCGGIRTLPLRGRTSTDGRVFTNAAHAVETAIQKISADYSVQAHFGTRWFSNIIRNINKAGAHMNPLPPVKRTAVTAAGPSLFGQTAEIRRRRKEFFLIAADTSLPCLLSQDIRPDAVVSIDCQHISYYHFMAGIPEETMLFLDLASPPLIASRKHAPVFFSGNHPLTGYICNAWRAFPEVDTSGGNVTYASVALAEKLGAETIELFGADFSYPLGLSYSRGTYIYPHFEIRQKRTAPLEGLHSSFLFRGPLEKINSGENWYYESPSLKFYREALEEKTKTMRSGLIPRQGMGAPVRIHPAVKTGKKTLSFFGCGIMKSSPSDFLSGYRDKIHSLKIPPENIAGFFDSLRGDEKQVFTTLLPAAAALKRRDSGLNVSELLEKTKSHCIDVIEKVLNTET